VDVFRELELEPIVDTVLEDPVLEDPVVEDPVVEYVVLVKGRLGGEHLH
jgi:hypothetical protein